MWMQKGLQAELYLPESGFEMDFVSVVGIVEEIELGSI